MTSEIRNNTGLSRYEMDADGHVAVACYTRAPGVITFTHTEVPRELEGRGIASALIRGALADARAQGLKVVARCPFVAAYLAKHPEFADLQA